MKVEVRAVGLKAMREKNGLTQRKLAHASRHQPELHSCDRGQQSSGVPEAPGPACEVLPLPVDELFEVVLVDPESHKEQVLEPTL